jgi:predicted regulator of Ras-like GTPase activity (Roadblock/LC7/MglB family)
MNPAVPRDSDDPARLPRRRVGAATGDTAQSGAPEGDRWASERALVGEALRRVSGQDTNVQGMLVASSDGLLLADDTDEVHVETVAAMAAAAASIAAQFTAQAEVGDPKGAMFEGSTGHVGVFPVEPRVLLVVLGRKDTTMGMFNIAAKKAVADLQQSMAQQRLLNASKASPPTQAN